MSTGNDNYFTIGEVSELTGVKPTVLRFWEQEFSELSPIKNKFGHRVYSQNEIDMVFIIKRLLYEERLTIEGAKNFLRGKNKLNYKPELVKKKLFELLDILKKKER
ncbi:MAG TPA: MerR family transcriptional regulator [Spirochaetota bacterium]|mgnify:CR=1 FL=1|nr:MerR family transcriptional regulator [Spirochaetota bacterium]